MKLKNLKWGADKAKIHYPFFSFGTDVENIHLECGNNVKIPIFLPILSFFSLVDITQNNLLFQFHFLQMVRNLRYLR